MRNFLVTLLGWAFTIFGFGMLALISLADRFGKKKDGSRSALTEASPQEAERPALPKNFRPAKPIKRKRAARTPDRVILGIHQREQARHD